MRWMGTFALGVAVALVSPMGAAAAEGEFGKAQIGFSKEVQAVWNGCTYKVRVEQDQVTGYPAPPFNIYARIEADPSGTCQTAPASTLVGTSTYEPDIFINVEQAGFVVGYNEWYTIRGMGFFTRAHVVQADLNTTSVLRHASLSGGYQPPGGGGGGPGSAFVTQLSVYNHATLVVQGQAGGNVICYNYSTTGCAHGTATQYTAVFPGFFTSAQAPVIYSY